jgi:hypothetical protein
VHGEEVGLSSAILACPCVLTWSVVNDTSIDAADPSPRSEGKVMEPELLPRGASKLTPCSEAGATSELESCTRLASTVVAPSPARVSFSMRCPSPRSEVRRPRYIAVVVGAWDVPLVVALAAGRRRRFVPVLVPVPSASPASCCSMAVKSEEQLRTTAVLVPG